jgi:hypothetical protein
MSVPAGRGYVTVDSRSPSGETGAGADVVQAVPTVPVYLKEDVEFTDFKTTYFGDVLHPKPVGRVVSVVTPVSAPTLGNPSGPAEPAAQPPAVPAEPDDDRTTDVPGLGPLVVAGAIAGALLVSVNRRPPRR